MKKLFILFLLFSSLAFGQDEQSIYGTSNTPYGVKYIDADSVTVLSVIGTYYAVALADGISKDVTQTDDSTFTVVKAGIYHVSISASFTHETNSTIVHFSVFVDDIEDASIECQRKIGNGGDVGSAGNSGLISLAVGEEVKVKAKGDTTGDLTVSHMNFNVFRIK